MRLLEVRPRARGAVCPGLILFLWCCHGFPSCQLVDQPESERSSSLLHPFFFSKFILTKGQSSDSWGLHKGWVWAVPSWTTLWSGLCWRFFFPLQEAQLLPHCQLLAGYYGNRSQEGSAFLPSWMRRRGLCEGQCFPLRGQENWLWVMGLT